MFPNHSSQYKTSSVHYQADKGSKGAVNILKQSKEMMVEKRATCSMPFLPYTVKKPGEMVMISVADSDCTF